jgi:hypothetical protein
VPADPQLPSVSPVFVVVVFAVAIAVGAIVAYLGVTGAMGGPIP